MSVTVTTNVVDGVAVSTNVVEGAAISTDLVDGASITADVTVGGTGAAGVDGITQDISGLLVKTSNLSDLTSASTARTNLGLGSISTEAAALYAALASANTFTEAITITGSTDTHQLIVKGSAGQSVGLQHWRNSSNTTLAYISSVGYAQFAGLGLTANAFIDGSADNIQLRVQGYSTQVTALQTWENSSATVLSSIDSAGAFVGGSVVAVKLWNRTVQGTGGGSLYIGGSATGGATDGVVIDGNATTFSASVTSGEWSSLRVGQNNNPNASSTAIHNCILVNPTINYASGGAGQYYGLRIKITETALPSGANYLIHAGAGAAGTTEKFSVTNAGVVTTAGKVIGPAATTSTATFNAPHGTAPSSPVDGDMWTTTAGLYVRINGSTVGPLS